MQIQANKAQIAASTADANRSAERKAKAGDFRQVLAEAKERSHKRGRKKASEKRKFLSKILTLLYSWIPTADFEYNKFQKK